ncbi:MAG: hypothetical protein ACE5I7_10730 [Candidatus Binatia bacterium]
MNHHYVPIGVVLGGLAMAILGGSPAWSEEHLSQRGSSSSMITAYAGPIDMHVSKYTGKLVCLQCDLTPGPGAMKQCEKKGHHHALSMDGNTMIHPLLAGTEAVLKQINSGKLHDKKVTVHGKYYPTTGFILVDRIDLAEKAD